MAPHPPNPAKVCGQSTSCKNPLVLRRKHRLADGFPARLLPDSANPRASKAGGQKCPIRFQCAGCGFYRPDPSYLPAIEDHVRELKADREMAEAMGVDDFVIRNLSDQVTAFLGVIERMNQRMADLPEEVRAEIQEASRVLRKVRATDGRMLLPLTVVNQQETSG